jgi:23S rRNA (adenine2030-N6)-methyltransferase
MNYRHAYHAGNFADVLKHAALVAVLAHLRKKQSPFAVIDAHGGRGLYDLSSEEAKKTGEARDGISRVLASENLPRVLQLYADIIRSFGDAVYPGSPLIAAKLLRAKDRLVAIEKHPEESEALMATLKGEPRARAIEGDFRRKLKGLLPPPERRGVVLIDPPYEADNEFQEVVHALIESHRRFATGTFLLWYPAKQRPQVSASAGELLNVGIVSLLQVELDVDGSQVPRSENRGPPLSAAGLLVVNPPFGFEDEMKTILPFLTRILGRGPDARFLLERLGGGG